MTFVTALGTSSSTLVQVAGSLGELDGDSVAPVAWKALVDALCPGFPAVLALSLLPSVPTGFGSACSYRWHARSRDRRTRRAHRGALSNGREKDVAIRVRVHRRFGCYGRRRRRGLHAGAGQRRRDQRSSSVDLAGGIPRCRTRTATTCVPSGASRVWFVRAPGAHLGGHRGIGVVVPEPEVGHRDARL